MAGLAIAIMIGFNTNDFIVFNGLANAIDCFEASVHDLGSDAMSVFVTRRRGFILSFSVDPPCLADNLTVLLIELE